MSNLMSANKSVLTSMIIPLQGTSVAEYTCFDGHRIANSNDNNKKIFKNECVRTYGGGKWQTKTIPSCERK